MNSKIPLTDFTESIAGMILYKNNMQYTNEFEFNQLKKILSKIMTSELTMRQQQCIFMKFYEKLTITEISIKLKISKSTVSKHIKKAQLRLYKLLCYYVT